MIKINLLGEVKAADHTAVLWLFGWGLSLVLLIGGGSLLVNSMGSQVEELTNENQLLEIQLKKLKEQTKSVGDLERKKKELDDKIQVITQLKRSKSGPVRVLDDLNLSIPERSWVTSIKESENVLRITGLALDNQTIATFMKEIVTSDYFEGVELIESKDAMRDAVRLKSFILDARINYAGKVKKAEGAAASAVSASSASSSSPAAASATAPTVASDKE